MQTSSRRCHRAPGAPTPRQKTEQGGFAPQNIYHRLNGMYYFASSDVLTPVELDVAGLRLALAGLSYHPGVVPGGDPLDHVEIVDLTLALSPVEKLRVFSLQRLAIPMRKGRGSVIGALAKVQDHLIG